MFSYCAVTKDIQLTIDDKPLILLIAELTEILNNGQFLLVFKILLFVLYIGLGHPPFTAPPERWSFLFFSHSLSFLIHCVYLCASFYLNSSLYATCYLYFSFFLRPFSVYLFPISQMELTGPLPPPRPFQACYFTLFLDIQFFQTHTFFYNFLAVVFNA